MHRKNNSIFKKKNNKHKNTPIHLAVIFKQIAVLGAMLEMIPAEDIATLEMKNTHGKTPYQIAEHCKYDKMADMIWQKITRSNAVMRKGLLESITQGNDFNIFCKSYCHFFQ